MTNNTNSTKKYEWGYLRETEEKALKAKINPVYGIHRTGLDTYLKVIFPNTKDWIHDKRVPNCIKNTRPDEGELVELGKHEELMSIEHGQYKALYEMQFKKQEVL